LYLHPEGRLNLTPYGETKDERDSYTYNPAVGVMSGILGRGNVTPWAMPLDQRLDEAYSLTYTSTVLDKDVEATGDPRADLFVSSSTEVAYFHVRLCDVAPDGISKLVSDGGLNATHRASHARPELLKAGEIYELNIPMKSMAYVFPAGHRIRVDISSADFHNAWPVSKPAVNAIHRSREHASRIILPVAPAQDPKLPLPDLKPSPNPLPPTDTVHKPQYDVTYDLVNQTVTVRTSNGASGSATFTVSSRKPGEAVMNATQDFVVSKPDMQVKVQAQCVTASDATSFRHLVEVEVTVNGKRHFNKSWSVQVPREMN
jgi:hypothetical protein